MCLSSPVAEGHPCWVIFLTLHSASELIIGSPTAEVNQEKFQLENEIRFRKAFGYLLQRNRNYFIFLNPENAFISP